MRPDTSRVHRGSAAGSEETKETTESKESKPASTEQQTEAPKKKKGFGLSRLTNPLGGEKQSAQVSASGGARGVDPERDAKGGASPAVVVVTLTPAEVDAFRKGIAG